MYNSLQKLRFGTEPQQCDGFLAEGKKGTIKRTSNQKITLLSLKKDTFKNSAKILEMIGFIFLRLDCLSPSSLGQGDSTGPWLNKSLTSAVPGPAVAKPLQKKQRWTSHHQLMHFSGLLCFHLIPPRGHRCPEKHISLDSTSSFFAALSSHCLEPFQRMKKSLTKAQELTKQTRSSADSLPIPLTCSAWRAF